MFSGGWYHAFPVQIEFFCRLEEICLFVCLFCDPIQTQNAGFMYILHRNVENRLGQWTQSYTVTFVASSTTVHFLWALPLQHLADVPPFLLGYSHYLGKLLIFLCVCVYEMRLYLKGQVTIKLVYSKNFFEKKVLIFKCIICSCCKAENEWRRRDKMIILRWTVTLNLNFGSISTNSNPLLVFYCKRSPRQRFSAAEADWAQPTKNNAWLSTLSHSVYSCKYPKSVDLRFSEKISFEHEGNSSWWKSAWYLHGRFF